jgi:hypothetical protein
MRTLQPFSTKFKVYLTFSFVSLGGHGMLHDKGVPKTIVDSNSFPALLRQGYCPTRNLFFLVRISAQWIIEN